jgi:exoribonuclease R
MSIYISNVAIILDYLDLWNRFSERVSTIYLPDRKRPMLPTILSENLCSLKKSERRFAISLDLFIENNIIIEEKFRNVLIEVKDNLSYKEANNLQNENYKLLHTVTKNLSKNAEYQEKFKNGIYRSVHMSKEPELPEDLKDEIASFFKIYHSMSGFYSKFENRSKHCYLFDKESSYLHITSPIRRLVDLLNLLKFQENLGEIKLNNNSKIFYENWLSRLDYINITMRSIKKVQNNCNLLFSCTNDSSLLEKEHLGYIFDKLERNDGLKQYSVYLENLNLISKVIIKEDLQNYEIKKKIRLKIIL